MADNRNISTPSPSTVATAFNPLNAIAPPPQGGFITNNDLSNLQQVPAPQMQPEEDFSQFFSQQGQEDFSAFFPQQGEEDFSQFFPQQNNSLLESAEVAGRGLLAGATLGLSEPVLTGAQAFFTQRPEESFESAYSRIGAETASLRDRYAAVDIISDIAGSFITGGFVLKLANKGLSAVGLMAKLNSLDKKARAIQKLAKTGTSIDLPKAHHLHNLLKDTLRKKAMASLVPRGIEGAAFGIQRSAMRSLGDTGDINPTNLAIGAAAGLVGGSIFGAGIPLAQAALKFKPKGVNAFRLRHEQDFIDAAYIKVRGIVEEMNIPDKDRMAVAQEKLADILQEANISTKLDDIDPRGNWFKFMRTGEKRAQIDRDFGVDTAGVHTKIIGGGNQESHFEVELGAPFYDAIEKLKKVGISEEQGAMALRYVESGAILPDGTRGPATFKFNSLGGKNIRSAWAESRVGREFGILSKEQTDLLIKVRDQFDFIASDPVISKELDGRHIKGYLPLYPKKGTEFTDRGNNFASRDNPALLKERLTYTGWDSSKHEANLSQIVANYVSQVSKVKAYGKIKEDIFNEAQKLMFLGKPNAAQEFLETSARALGMNTKKNFTKELSSELGIKMFEQNEELITAAIRKVPAELQIKTFDKVLDLIHKSMYANILFTNPGIQVKQFVQSLAVGVPEIGAKAVKRGTLIWGIGGKASTNLRIRKITEEMMPRMKDIDPGKLQDMVINPKHSFTTANKILGFAGKLGAYLFNKGDTRNRGIIFSGAYEQMETFLLAGSRNFKQTFPIGLNREKLINLMEGMLPAEQSLVLKALQKEGISTASKIYGVLRSRRVNFAYGMADTPELFATGIGRFIPFTTWSSNMFMRHMGDLQSGSASSLAKRIAYPIIAHSTFKAVTGYELPGVNPTSSIPGAFAMQIVPAVNQTIGAFQQKGMIAGFETLSKFTPIGPIRGGIQNVSDLLKPRSKGKDRGEIFFGIKQLKEKNKFKRALPGIIRGMVK